jgi:uncharacterized protein involved in outer membrane biogenesis
MESRIFDRTSAVPNILSESVMQDAPPESAAPPRRSWAWLPKGVVLLLAFFWLASVGISLLITHTRLQRRITGRLENVFGRHVEVGRYDFSLWRGPTLEAQSVTFAEDPRFGYEYFLRAESLTVRLRWQSLLRGHMELGRVSLTRPSLNLVRNEAGDWNLAEWLPRPAAPPSSAAASNANVSPYQPAYLPGAQPTVRFTRIEVDSGRINFKRGNEKIPFAFITVNGYVEPDGPGRWRVNLEATPTRAAVALQTPGTIFLSGRLGGTSSRLRPASLDLAWADASIPDVLRLFRGYDFGVRGNLAVLVHAETEGEIWNLQARSQLRELHRWDLPMRADNLALNVNGRMILSPLASGLAVTDATIEAPSSFARATAHFTWAGLEEDSPKQSNPDRIEITQSQIDLKDAVAWLRGFRPDVAADISASGTVNSTASFRGWPPRLAAASAAVRTAELASPRLRVPAYVSQFHLHYDSGGIVLSPTSIDFGNREGKAGSFHFESSTTTSKGDAAFRLTGNLSQVRDLIATASALGWNISRGWDLAGPVRCDLHWPADALPWDSQPSGSVDWGAEESNASLLTPFLDQPVERIRAHADLKLDSRHIALTAADAFGAHWTGTFDNHDDGQGWQFAVSADQLATSDLDRWLNPHWRESLIYRVLPFLNPNSPTNSVPENFRASGRLSIDEFRLAPVVLERFHADLTVGGRHLEIANAKAQFYGGALDGSLDAQLTARPHYRLAAEYTRVDLATLTAALPSLAALFAGSASGDIALSFSGASQSDLFSSLQCSGSARVADAEIRTLNLADTLRTASLRPGSSSFREAAASFTCADEKINFRDLSLEGASQKIQGTGLVNFDRTLDLQLSQAASPSPERGVKSGGVANAVELTGSLASPGVRRTESTPSKP